jgi:hypothetical protein
MILSKKEKEERVIKLLNDGLRFKDIAKQAHVSLSDISKIKRKITGEETPKELPQLSIASQSFQLFLDGKSLVKVAIILDISKDEVIHRYLDYLISKNMKDVVAILQEYKNNLSSFVPIFVYSFSGMYFCIPTHFSSS